MIRTKGLTAMTYTDAYWTRHLAWQRYRRVIESGASLQAIHGAFNLLQLAERRLRLTPHGPLTLSGRCCR
jgi:hypothetical protein